MTNEKLINNSCMSILIIVYNISNSNENINKNQISKKLKLSYTCIVKNIIVLQKLNLVTTFRKGRNSFVKLTERGEFVSKTLINLNNYIGEKNIK